MHPWRLRVVCSLRDQIFGITFLFSLTYFSWAIRNILFTLAHTEPTLIERSADGDGIFILPPPPSATKMIDNILGVISDYLPRSITNHMELRTQTPGEVNGDRQTRTRLRRPIRHACQPCLLVELRRLPRRILDHYQTPRRKDVTERKVHFHNTHNIRHCLSWSTPD